MRKSAECCLTCNVKGRKGSPYIVNYRNWLENIVQRMCSYTWGKKEEKKRKRNALSSCDIPQHFHSSVYDHGFDVPLDKDRHADFRPDRKFFSHSYKGQAEVTAERMIISSGGLTILIAFVCFKSYSCVMNKQTNITTAMLSQQNESNICEKCVHVGNKVIIEMLFLLKTHLQTSPHLCWSKML